MLENRNGEWKLEIERGKVESARRLAGALGGFCSGVDGAPDVGLAWGCGGNI